jgi:hypothetical protein
MRDLLNNIHPVPAIPPGAAVTDNTPIVSSIIDRLGFNSLAILIAMGDLADTNATFAVTMEHGDEANLSDTAAVPAELLSGTLALAGFTYTHDNKTRKVGYVGGKRYVRLTITPAGNTGNAFVSAVAVLGHPASAPTANPPS